MPSHPLAVANRSAFQRQEWRPGCDAESDTSELGLEVDRERDNGY